MADYSPSEFVDMISIVGVSRTNFKAAEKLYAETYPNRRCPNRRMIQKIKF